MSDIKPPPKTTAFDKVIAHDGGKKFADMTGLQKTVFILKLIICICTFGFAFPNVQSD
ncbi:MAG TPA: hypothetical protein VM183_00530 [Burkholderiales bacterium]|nr:hypothetical protein [Burkholderiales bacterium]